MRSAGNRLALGALGPKSARYVREVSRCFELARRIAAHQPKNAPWSRVMVVCSERVSGVPTRGSGWAFPGVVCEFHIERCEMRVRIHTYRNKPRQEVPVDAAHRKGDDLNLVVSQCIRENLTNLRP